MATAARRVTTTEVAVSHHDGVAPSAVNCSVSSNVAFVPRITAILRSTNWDVLAAFVTRTLCPSRKPSASQDVPSLRVMRRPPRADGSVGSAAAAVVTAPCHSPSRTRRLIVATTSVPASAPMALSVSVCPVTAVTVASTVTYGSESVPEPVVTRTNWPTAKPSSRKEPRSLSLPRVIVVPETVIWPSNSRVGTTPPISCSTTGAPSIETTSVSPSVSTATVTVPSGRRVRRIV